VERTCSRPVEVLASSDPLVTLGKLTGTSCYGSVDVDIRIGNEVT